MPSVPQRRDMLKVGGKVQALWKEDNAYYAAEILAVVDKPGGKKGYKVKYTEYGNEAEVLDTEIKVESAPPPRPESRYPGTPAAAAEDDADAAPAGSLQAQLAAKKLKKAEERVVEPKEAPVEETGNILAALQKTLQSRRAGIAASTYGGPSMDFVDNDDEWGDDDEWLN